MIDAKNIIILSYPRSGTHLLLNTIANNLEHNLVFKRWEAFSPTYRGAFSPPDLSKSYLIKSHAADYKSLCNEIATPSVISNSTLIYIYRDPFEVMRSSYYYYPTWSVKCQALLDDAIKEKKDPFEEFILKSTFLKERQSSLRFWLKFSGDQKILSLSFSDLINNYEETLRSLSDHTNLRVRKKIIRPTDSCFSKPAGVVSPKLTKFDEFDRKKYLPLIEKQIQTLDESD